MGKKVLSTLRALLLVFLQEIQIDLINCSAQKGSFNCFKVFAKTISAY